MSSPDRRPVDQTPKMPQPMRRNDLDLSFKVVLDLFLKRTMLEETTSTLRLATALGLSLGIIDEAFEDLRGKKYIDVRTLIGNEYIFSLTAAGREAAVDRVKRCAYSGIAPVTLSTYTQVVNGQKARLHVSRASLQRAFSDLVINGDLLDRVGPAFASQKSAFLYGPTGTGKTSIAERLVRLYDDHVLIPRAVEVDSQIMTVFDPVVHREVHPQPDRLDPRFVLCERPFVMVGGELTPEMLQLQLDSTSMVYSAPLQMKANNGVLLVDDFGRQLMPPAALLNRWIVPLDRKIDFLTLSYGLKFSIPFELFVVFSTNLDPSELGDQAFFRRIENKIHIGAVTDNEFDWILAKAVQLHRLRVDPEAPPRLRDECRRRGDGALRPCYPWDIARLARVVCDYESLPAVLTPSILTRALDLYFTDDPSAGFGGRAGQSSGASNRLRAELVGTAN